MSNGPQDKYWFWWYPALSCCTYRQVIFLDSRVLDNTCSGTIALTFQPYISRTPVWKNMPPSTFKPNLSGWRDMERMERTVLVALIKMMRTSPASDWVSLWLNSKYRNIVCWFGTFVTQIVTQKASSSCAGILSWKRIIGQSRHKSMT